jgi:hypothetical protein
VGKGDRLKKSWQSKTLIVNLIMAVVPFLPGGEEFVQANPDMVMTGLALVNIVLRLITKDKVEIK